MKIVGERHIIHIFEIVLLVLLMGLTGAVLAADSLTEADTWALNVLFANASPELLSFFSLATLLGDLITIFIVSSIVMLALLAKKLYRFAIGFVVAVGGATASEILMKEIIERARPEGLSEIVPASFSYPSGHAAVSMALYGFLVYLAFLLFPKYRLAVALVGAVIIVLVGLSRLYLGVHYPSDVIAGYCLAALWIFIGAKVAHWGKRAT